MNTKHVFEFQLGMLLDKVLQIRLVLEEVRVDFLVIRGKVRLHIVIEFDNLELYALFFKQGLYGLQDLGMRDGGSADLNGLWGTCAA